MANGNHVIHLLLVDDEAEFRAAARQALERRGFRVSEAASGAQARRRLAEARPDAVLLDLRLGDSDGIEVLREIRETDAELPVIILTGHGRYEDALAGIGLEIVDFIQKPVDLGQMAARIRARLLADHGRPLCEREIRDLMVSPDSYQRVHADQRLREVVEVLRDSLRQPVRGRAPELGHRSLLVYDRQEQFVGLLRIRDVLRAAIPGFLRDSPYASYFTGMFLAQCKVVGTYRVRDLLGGPPPLDVHTPLIEAVHLMVEYRAINLAVVDNSELVGILRDKDLLLELTEALAGDHVALAPLADSGRRGAVPA